MLCCHVPDLTGTELRLTNPKRDKEVVVQTFVDREQRFTKFTKSIKTTTTKTYLNLKINKSLSKFLKKSTKLILF